jgi:poly-gamma-glutamate capsule biosynthesis protein CapA/YwtB (metallophosphatase superfamily)
MKGVRLLALFGIVFTALFIVQRVDAPTQVFYPTPTPQGELPMIDIPPLNLGTIFAGDHSWIDALPEDEIVTMIATGDVIPARSVNTRMRAKQDFRWPFANTHELLSSADLTVINLETPLMKDCVPTDEGMIFCGDARATQGLVYAGVDVATLGNNHIGNHFVQGIHETKELLSSHGIVPVAEGHREVDVKGVRFAFLAYNDIGAPEEGVPWADLGTVMQDIAHARTRADVVIVAYHWGVEYVRMPHIRQKELAYASIDAGADIVLGNHPHWIQPVELYNGKFIIYAHGNFVFDQMWSEETKHGVVGRYTFYKKQLVDVQYIPVYIEDYGQPMILPVDRARAVLNMMHDASKSLLYSTP